MSTFNPQDLFNALPTFFSEQLASFDRELLGKYWEAMVRVVDAEYVRLFETVDSVKVREAKVFSTYPWVYQEFDGWTSRRTRHQHLIRRLAGDSSGIFYLGRFVDPTKVKVYYDGYRQRLTLPTIITNEQNSSQLMTLLGLPGEDIGTRIEMRTVTDGETVASTAFGDPTKEVVIEAERELHQGLIINDGSLTSVDAGWYDETDAFITEGIEIDPDFASLKVESRLLNNLAEYSIDNVSAEYPTVTLTSGFRAGQILRVLRLNGNVHDELIDADGPTYQLKYSKTEAGSSQVAAVLLVYNFQLYPNGVTIEANRLVFATPVPVGVRVRVVDPSGTQSILVTTARRIIPLTSPVDPDATSVFVFNVDMTDIDVTASGYDWKRPMLNQTVVAFSAPLVHGHDHARHTEVVLSAKNTITLPSDRPLAINADLTESARYPVKVYVDGQLLKSSLYTFVSTTSIQKVSGTFNPGERLDVLYTDAEEIESHIHFQQNEDVADNQSKSVVEFEEELEPSRYPISVETEDGPLIPMASHPVALNRFVQLRPTIDGPTRVFTEGIARGLNYRYTVPTRVDDSEGYKGTLVSAEALQDSLDQPTNVSTDDSLIISRSGDETVVESDVAYAVGWFKNAKVDEHRLNDVLGLPIGFLDGGESSARYRDVLMSLYAAYYRGSQKDTLENFGCIILGSDFARKGGLNRGVEVLDSELRVRRVEDANGSQADVALHASIPDRIVGPNVPVFFAASAYCQLVDRDLTEIPYLAFFAESLSADYRYAKRMDVWVPDEHSSTVSSYDKNTGELVDWSADFIDWEVWPRDLIKLTTAGVDEHSIAAATVFARVERVIDRHTLIVRIDLDTATSGWGEPDGWGETTGWGGFLAEDDLESYTIWTRRTRRLDTYKFFDEMLDDSQALADGESVQKVNALLSSILRHSVFVVQVAWAANQDVSRLDELKLFLNTTKPAEVGYFAYTKVNDDSGITDLLEGAVVDRGPELIPDGRYTMIGLDFIESMFIAPNTELAGIGSVTFDDSWWDPS